MIRSGTLMVLMCLYCRMGLWVALTRNYWSTFWRYFLEFGCESGSLMSLCLLQESANSIQMPRQLYTNITYYPARGLTFGLLDMHPKLYDSYMEAVRQKFYPNPPPKPNCCPESCGPASKYGTVPLLWDQDAVQVCVFRSPFGSIIAALSAGHCSPSTPTPTLSRTRIDCSNILHYSDILQGVPSPRRLTLALPRCSVYLIFHRCCRGCLGMLTCCGLPRATLQGSRSL